MPSTNRARLVRALYAFVLLAAAPAAHAACSAFGAATAVAALASPQMAVTADFDRDGRLDVAVACGTGATLQVLRGLGGGAFAAPVAYASGTAGRAVAIGDFDGNGAPDAAVCVATGVAVWYGPGDGTLAGGAILPLGSSPRGIVCADFDEDGVQDLAVASANTHSVLVARGNGANGVPDGTFAAGVAYAVGTAPARLVAGDWNGDGILDLAVANNSSANVSILRGLGTAARGDGTFATAVSVAVAGSPWGLAVADADRDGDPDLLVSNGAGTTLTFLRNGGATFAAAGTCTTPTAPRDLVVGDFDGDALADVAAACAAGNAVAVLRGDGAGGFAPLATFATGTGAQGLAAGDWNGDGTPDLLAANTGAGTLSRLLGACPPATGSGVTLLAPNGGEPWWPGLEQEVRWAAAGGVTAVDLDLSRDDGVTWRPLARGVTGGRATFNAAGAPGPALRVRVRDALVPARADVSDAPFTACDLFGGPVATPAGFAVEHLATADVDGDGALELLATGGGLARVLRPAGGGAFGADAPFALPAAMRVRLADVDGDGRTDVIALGAGGLAVRAGDGAGGFGELEVLPFADGADVAVGDFDEDGAPDLAVLSATGGGARLAVLRRAQGAWNETWSALLDGAPGRLECADLDGDGVADLVLTAGTHLQVWAGRGAAGRGDGTFALASDKALPVAGGDLLVGDTDADGRLDVGVCVAATGDLWTFGGAGGAVNAALELEAPVTASAGGPAASPTLADFDGDGLADLALALPGSARVAVLPGTAGGFAAARTFAGGGGALVVGEFSGDGSADVVVAAGDSLVCLPSVCPPQRNASVALAVAAPAPALAGFERTVAWTRGPAVAAVRVELSRDDGAHWATIADGLSGDSLAWTVTGPPTEAARLRVSDPSVSARAGVSAPFAIRAAYAAAGAAAAPAQPAALATGDLEGDAFADAALVDGARLRVLRGGAAGFTEVLDAPAPGARRVAIADTDRDGRADVITLSGTWLAVRLGLADGGFAEPLDVGTATGSAAFAPGDFDEDGVTDVAVASSNGAAHRLTVLRGVGAAGAPAFAAGAPVALPAAPAALAGGDFDGDGVGDLAVTHAAGLSVLLGRGTGGRGDGTFRVALSRAFGSRALPALLAADLDGDGRLDLAAPDSAAHALVLARGDGAGAFGPPVSLAVPLAPRTLAATDADGDGRPELVAGSADTTLVLRCDAWFAGAAPAVAWGGGGGATLAVRDADGDGIADLLRAGGGALHVARGAIASGAAAPRVLAPNGGERADAGGELLVRWSAGGPVDVELSRDGERWERLASDSPGTSFIWNVCGPFTGLARIRVRESAVPVRADASDAPFLIVSTALDAATAPPADWSLTAPWPNPSRGAVALRLALPRAGAVTADVVDVSGRRVRALHRGPLAAGVHVLHWDGAGDDGTPAGAGLYWVHVRPADSPELTRMLVRVR